MGKVNWVLVGSLTVNVILLITIFVIRQDLFKSKPREVTFAQNVPDFNSAQVEILSKAFPKLSAAIPELYKYYVEEIKKTDQGAEVKLKRLEHLQNVTSESSSGYLVVDGALTVTFNSEWEIMAVTPNS